MFIVLYKSYKAKIARICCHIDTDLYQHADIRIRYQLTSLLSTHLSQVDCQNLLSTSLLHVFFHQASCNKSTNDKLQNGKINKFVATCLQVATSG